MTTKNNKEVCVCFWLQSLGNKFNTKNLLDPQKKWLKINLRITTQKYTKKKGRETKLSSQFPSTIPVVIQMDSPSYPVDVG
jgi:hypothetical protein